MLDGSRIVARGRVHDLGGLGLDQPPERRPLPPAPEWEEVLGELKDGHHDHRDSSRCGDDVPDDPEVSLQGGVHWNVLRVDGPRWAGWPVRRVSRKKRTGSD